MESPTVPTGLVASATSPSQIDLTWTASTDNVAVGGYAVYRDGSFLVTLGNITSYQDTGLAPSTTYSYSVLAFDAAANGSRQSASASATTLAPDVTPPSTPASLTATALSTSSIELSWGASTDDVAVAGYRVFRDGALVASPGNVTGFRDNGLNPGTTYSYTVLAFDGAGNLSPQSPAATATTMAPDTIPPSTPAGVIANAISGSQINVTWPPSTDNVAVVGYKIFLGGSLIATLGNIGSYQATGLTPGTLYSFTVSAFDAAGNESAQSSPPATATTLMATGSVTLEWDAVMDARLSGYRVYFSEGNQGNYQVAGQGLDAGNVTEYPVTGLLSGTRYYFKVTAYDGLNVESAYSNEIFIDLP